METSATLPCLTGEEFFCLVHEHCPSVLSAMHAPLPHDLPIEVAGEQLVPRARFTDRLADPGRLVLVVAPAELGKTSVLTEWPDRADGSSMAWLSLAARDNNATQFWNHLVAAITGPTPLLHKTHANCSPRHPPRSRVVGRCRPNQCGDARLRAHRTEEAVHCHAEWGGGQVAAHWRPSGGTVAWC